MNIFYNSGEEVKPVVFIGFSELIKRMAMTSEESEMRILADLVLDMCQNIKDLAQQKKNDSATLKQKIPLQLLFGLFSLFGEKLVVFEYFKKQMKMGIELILNEKMDEENHKLSIFECWLKSTHHFSSDVFQYSSSR